MSIRHLTDYPYSCAEAGIETIRLIVDDATVMNGDVVCDELDGGLPVQELGPLPAGPHSVRVDGLDLAGDVRATSSPIDVTILAAATAQAMFVLKVP